MNQKIQLPIRMTALLACSLLLFTCKKEGVGGDATIRGYVKAEKWNSTFTQFIGEYPAKGVYVYIQYNDTLGYDDRILTDYHGFFEFPFLYKGDYHLYTYSRDSTGKDLSGEVPVIRNIHINNRTETVEVDTIVVFQ